MILLQFLREGAAVEVVTTGSIGQFSIVSQGASHNRQTYVLGPVDGAKLNRLVFV